MKKFVVKAYNGIGKAKVFVGEREIDQPENLAEALQCEGGKEDEVLGHYWSSKVIDVQRQIRAKTGESAKSQLSAILSQAKANLDAGDSKLAEMLKAANIKLPWEAQGNGQTQETPTTPQTSETSEKEPEAEKPAPKKSPRKRG